VQEHEPVMNLDVIATLLHQQIGIDPQIIGDRKIARAIETRRVACRLSDTDAYLKILQSSTQEFDQLVEQIVVPETWFFRDRKPFDFLVNFVRSEWLPKSGAAKLRVLSVPCSTGEEPYSIAIALVEAGLSTNRFSIDAVDISHIAIAKTKRAIYGKNSFRGAGWVERSRYFQAVDDKHEVCTLIRSTVKFQQGNLLNIFANAPTKYDIIFCRNLLIYLEDSVCTQILNTLHRLLSPQGLLFIGASETGKVPSDRFSFLRQSFTFAYRKLDMAPLQLIEFKPVEVKPKRSVSISSVQLAANNQSTAKSTATLRRPIASATVRSTTATPVNASSNSDLQQAKELADTGYLEAAISHCKSYLENSFTNVEAHTLLGTLYQATANYDQAERCFQKALYLQPSCYEALMHLALLKEYRGDPIAAQRLQHRIEKLQ